MLRPIAYTPLCLLLSIAVSGCERTAAPQTARVPGTAPVAQTGQGQDGEHERAARLAMVKDQIETRGINDPRVLSAMRAVPRHAFVPEEYADAAYEDHPIAIGHEQTISQPYIVALMTELAELEPGDRVLEVGTGSGYQAAVLAALGVQVYSIEIVEPLARSAAARLARLGFDVEVRAGDGFAGWPEHAPYAAILITAAPPQVPEPLKQQLAPGGRLVVPVGRAHQQLITLTRTQDGFKKRSVLPVRFVPMTGTAQHP